MRGCNQHTQFKHIHHVCYACGDTKTTANTRGLSNWYLNYDADSNMLCAYCYQKIIHHPKYRPVAIARSKNLIRFGSMQQLQGTFRALTGYCSKCPNNIFDGSCKTTQMHHLIYIRILPWFGREELCPSCHITETRKGWQCLQKRIRR
jgi:hypothetical protein